jgi:hypothetical protein
MSAEKKNTNYKERGTGGVIPEQRNNVTSRGNENAIQQQGDQVRSDTRSQISQVVPDIVKKQG